MYSDLAQETLKTPVFVWGSGLPSKAQIQPPCTQYSYYM